MNPEFGRVWVYLSASPLLWLTATLLAYQIAFALYARARFHPLLNPVATAIALLIVVLLATGTPYERYFEGAQFVHFLLGPATVALAIPLHQQWAKLRRNWLALLIAALTGSAIAIGLAMGLAHALGASPATVLSLAPKAVTTPIAMGVAEKIGGLPSLTAVLVILTGILGAVFARGVFKRLRIEDDSVCGFALGVTSHGIGTARAFQVSEEAGAFSGLGMAVSGVLTALLLPFVLRLFGVA